MLKLVVVMGGAVLMALEMVASRVLAPQFGSSIFVWGSLISIFLIAISVGNYWGGRLADRSPRLSLLAALVAAPGVMIWSLPFYASDVTRWIAGLELGPRLGPLAAAFILFAVPSIFLGTISPYAIRLEVRSVETVGDTAGKLYALSTAGSIVGTLGASFLLIPSFGVRSVLHGLGIALLLLALAAAAVPSGTASRRAGHAAGEKRRQAGPVRERRPRRGAGGATSGTARMALGPAEPRRTLLLLGGLAMVLALAYASRWSAAAGDVLYEKDGLYHKIIVQDRGSIRHLHFDNTYQSAMDLENPGELVFLYTRYLHLAKVFAPEAKNVLFLGLGGGSIQKSFHAEYPDMRLEVAEIDPDVVEVAKRFFGVREDRRLTIHTVDGRLFLQKTAAQYDIAVLDAFSYDTIPFHLTTREFLEELSERLSPGGVVAANVIGAVEGPRSRLFRSMVRTYQEVFPQVYIFPVGRFDGRGDSTVRNIILIATKSGERLSKEALAARAAALFERREMIRDVRPFLDSLLTAEVPTHDVVTLTDDYAPVDSLQHF